MNKKCDDRACPIHGEISVRGKLIEGKVIKMKSKKTATIEIKRIKFLPKYERYLISKSKISVHCPECMDISVGDDVVCGETRKISKTKSFVILRKISKTKVGDTK